ncbi:hypothetical protein [Bdellovibrio sp. HCB288]|uniref:hypothetical protein n=1 Tax=Bdellovibrio sp. HCB288 TaxID=3394355 RepID=UPI0039B43F1E
MLNSLIISLVLASHADSLTCTRGVIRQTTGGAVIAEAADYCFNEEKNRLISKNCKNRDCPAFDRLKIVNFSEIYGQHSNPGFNLCRKLEGHPQIIEFKVGKEWYALDRCVFKDGTFADVGQLLGFYTRK